MKTLISTTIAFFTILIFLSSCTTTNDVVSNNGIVKRKYRKGYYVQQSRLFNKQPQVFVALSKEESIENMNGGNREMQLVAAVENDPAIVINKPVIADKSVSTFPEAMKSVQNLYDSEIRDFTTFRKEYKKIKTDIASSLIVSKKGGEDSRYALSILSFASGIIGFFIAGIILGALAVILGIIALAKKKKGAALAILGIVFGIIDIILVSIYLSTL